MRFHHSHWTLGFLATFTIGGMSASASVTTH